MTKMSKVYFRHGAMESSKSLQLLAVAHNYESQGRRVMCFKPALDDRSPEIATRAGFSREADVVLDVDDNDIVGHVRRFGIPSCVLIDEAQFLTRDQVYEFTEVADKLHIPVIAYGLKNDSFNDLFEGTYAWLALADKIEEIKTVCTYCNSKALMNPRFVNGIASFEGSSIEVGDTEESDRKFSYKPTCRNCYKKLRRGIILMNKK